MWILIFEFCQRKRATVGNVNTGQHQARRVQWLKRIQGAQAAFSILLRERPELVDRCFVQYRGQYVVQRLSRFVMREYVTASGNTQLVLCGQRYRFAKAQGIRCGQ